MSDTHFSREVPRGTFRRDAKPCAYGCGRQRDRPGQSFCRACHAAYMVSWRRLQRQMNDFRDERLRQLQAQELRNP